EALGAFELSGGLRRPKAFDPGRQQIVREPCDEGGLRTDDHEPYIFCAAEIHHGTVIRHIQRYAGCDIRNSGVSGCTVEPGQQRAGAHRPGEGMFAPARADQKDVHEWKTLGVSRNFAPDVSSNAQDKNPDGSVTETADIKAPVRPNAPEFTV